jgi:hypothetical protein
MTEQGQDVVRPKRTRSAAVKGPDGYGYSSTINEEINQLVAGCFGGGAGVRTLQYLESITTRRVLGPDASNEHLRHLEGARWLVGVIRERIAAAKR